MSCCLSVLVFLKKKCIYIGKEVDDFLNRILEIDVKKSDNKNNPYKRINMEEINKDDDHTIIDIDKEYDII
jgi:hypothetical protein